MTATVGHRYELHQFAPRPWRVLESKGGKMFMYDASGKPIIIPNISATDRGRDELLAIYHAIVQAVNSEYETFGGGTR